MVGHRIAPFADRAFRLSLKVTAGGGFGVAETFGFPSGGDTPSAELAVGTVFLSKRKGALVVRFASPDSPADFSGFSVSATLDYATLEGEHVAGRIDARYDGSPLDPRGQYAQQPSVGRSIALAMLVSAMKQSAEQYESSQTAAVATMTKAVDRFTADVGALGDAALEPELQLAADLLDLMEHGAPQGSLYGGR